MRRVTKVTGFYIIPLGLLLFVQVLVVTLNIQLLTKFCFGITGYVLSVGLADLISAPQNVTRRQLWQFLTCSVSRNLFSKMMRL